MTGTDTVGMTELELENVVTGEGEREREEW
jgi:hypothetical protein